MKKLLIILLLFLTPCFALEWDGNSLLETCEGADATLCGAYISGVSDALYVENLICPDERVTHGQMIRVVTKYLQNNPELLPQNTYPLIKNALQAAFPCK